MKKRNPLPAKSPELEGRKPETLPRQEFDPTLTLLVAVHGHHLEKIGGKDNPLSLASHQIVRDLMRRFTPRDSVEEMMFAQMVLTHGRMAYLTAYADQQTNLKWATMMHEAANRAANTFRRQMLALAEYRRPPRANTFTAIGQANIAQQQVVQNRISENEKATNEQGSFGRTDNPKTIPPDAGRAEITAGISAHSPALAIEHGAEDAGRQSAGERERTKAR